jgi:phosphatidylglycerophosphate synthase
MATTAPDRRPIPARHWRVSTAIASWMVRRGISPNTISIAGAAFGVAAGAALAATARQSDQAALLWTTGAVCVLLRLLANMFDGMVAVEGGRASRVGELFNEVPDRLSDVAILIGLGYATGGDVVLGYLSALAAIFTAYVRAMGKAAGAAQEFCGPMAKPQRMALVIAVSITCAVVAETRLPAAALAVILAGSLFTAIRRLVRIARHLRGDAP